MGRDTKDFVEDVAMIGGTGLLFVVATNLALQRTQLTGVQKAAVQAAVGTVAGAVLAKYAPRAAAGIAVGGVIGGGEAIAEQVRMAAYLRALAAGKQRATDTTTAAPSTPQLSASTQPAAGVYGWDQPRVGVRTAA